MSTIKTIAFACFLLLTLSINAATYSRPWLKTCDSANGSDVGTELGLDAEGNVFVGGTSAFDASSPYITDYLLIKYSNSGVLLWSRRYHGPGPDSDNMRALVVDSAGDVIVTGNSSRSSNAGDTATIKYSGAGVPLWTNRYTSAIGTAVGVDSNRNVFVAGGSLENGIVVLKYSPAGIPLWTNMYHGPSSYHYASRVVVDATGKVFVCGISEGTGDDWVTLAYSNTGVPLWTNRFGGPEGGEDAANGMALDGNGNVFVTGGVQNGGQTEFATIKYSNAGAPIWTNRYRSYGGSTYGGASDVRVDANGNVFITGQSIEGGTYGDVATLKYSNAGTALWTNRYSGIYPDGATGLELDRSGNVYVIGFTEASNLRYDSLVISYSSQGTLLWSATYNGQGNDDDSCSAIGTDDSGNVFVTGYSRSTNGYPDILTIKYSTPQVSPPLAIEHPDAAMVLKWKNDLYGLQSSGTIGGTFTNVIGAVSPYTNSTEGGQRYFRLKAK